MISIDINRLTISLHGVSALIAEQAISGLEQELHRRLGVMADGDWSTFDAAELSIGPVNATMQLDASSLRSLLVERLIEQIRLNSIGSQATDEEPA